MKTRYPLLRRLHVFRKKSYRGLMITCDLESKVSISIVLLNKPALENDDEGWKMLISNVGIKNVFLKEVDAALITGLYLGL